jgi:hypothetical protein
MNSIDQTFPGLVTSCAQLYALLMPWGMALMVLAFAFQFWSGPLSPIHWLKFIAMLFCVVLLLAQAHTLINSGQTLIQQWVQQNIPSRPENVAARYKQKLAEAQNAPELKNKSFWRTLFSSNWFEALIYAFLVLISWLAMAMIWFIYNVQRVVLLLCWALCPLLFPLMTIRPVSGIGIRHLLRIIAVVLWPLGLALAATCTDGLLDSAVNQDFLTNHAIAGSLGYGLQNLLAITVIAIWIIISTVAAPAVIHKLIVGSPGSATVITSASSLVAGVALPGIFKSVSFLWQSRDQIRGMFSSSSTSQPPPPSPGASGSDPSAPLPWEPNPGDPTGDQAAQAIVEETKKL